MYEATLNIAEQAAIIILRVVALYVYYLIII